MLLFLDEIARTTSFGASIFIIEFIIYFAKNKYNRDNEYNTNQNALDHGVNNVFKGLVVCKITRISE